LMPGRVATNYECGFNDYPPRDVVLRFENWEQQKLPNISSK